MRMISWNVNGIRAVHRKKSLEWLMDDDFDLFMIQETKAKPEQFPKELCSGNCGEVFSASAEKKGYSGVATFTKVPVKPFEAEGMTAFSNEGRISSVQIGNTVIYNVYFPNGQRDQARLDYKMDFYDSFLRMVMKDRSEGLSVIFCGDVNTAHREIDLARPKENSNRSGFLPIEREWITKVLNSGFIDTFRHVNGDVEAYSWWDYKTRARERNVGWRIDYFFVSEDLKDKITDAGILNEIFGSDHCPIYLEISI